MERTPLPGKDGRRAAIGNLPFPGPEFYQRPKGEFALQTRFVIISNELPRLADASGALASRFIVLLLANSFYGKEDQTLTSRLLTELPGILNWAIAGWHRLAGFGHFQQPESAIDAAHQLEDLGSPIGTFIREQCEIGPFYRSEGDEMFQAWCNWCGDQGRDYPGTKQSFGRDLHAACPGLKVIQPRDGIDRARVYQGIRTKRKMIRTVWHAQARNPEHCISN